MRRRRGGASIPLTTLALVLLWAGPAAADDNPEEEDTRALIRALQQQLAQIQTRYQQDLQAMQQQYQAAIQALQDQVAALQAQPAQAPTAPAPPGGAAPRSGRGVFQNLNPNLSVIGDFIAQYRDFGPDAPNDRDFDFTQSEVEFAFQMIADPYIKVDVIAALESGHGEEEGDEHGHGDEEEAEGHGVEIDLEEAYLTTLGLPGNFQARVGKFLPHVGRLNAVHRHAHPFTDVPLLYERFLGEEGYRDEGFEVSWLAPTPFFWEFLATLQRGPTENPTFLRAEGDDYVFTGRSSLLFDVTPNTTLQVGGTYMEGPGTHEGDGALLRAADLTLKWKPARRNTYRGIWWQTEYMERDLHREETVEVMGMDEEHLFRVRERALYTFFEVRLSRRWFLGARADWWRLKDEVDLETGDVEAEDLNDDSQSLILSFWPSEFQTIRFQVNTYSLDTDPEHDHRVFFEWIWTIGAHGAHQY